MDLTEALTAMTAAYPGFENVRFGALGPEDGAAIIPEDGEAVESVRRSVTGRVRRVGVYPFAVALRLAGPSEERRAAAKEKLEALGAYLEAADMPRLTDGMKLLSVARTRAAHMDSRTGDRTECWVIHMAARYETTI